MNQKQSKYLSRAEEMILLAVWRLKDNAYGVSIREELKKMTGREWAFGALFVTLERMAKKDLLRSSLSEPTRERGGRRKRLYRLTLDAVEALKAVRELQRSAWADSPDLLSEKP
jgi:DNA-binding PadR family transcriptional regulator